MKMGWVNTSVTGATSYWALGMKLSLAVGVMCSVMMSVQAHGDTKIQTTSNQATPTRFQMDFRQACESYREKEYGYMGLSPNPPDYSTYNGVLFSAVRFRLLTELGQSDVLDMGSIPNSTTSTGFLLRYPTRPVDFSAWDDVVGLASVSPSFAKAFLKTMRENKWVNGNISLRRFIFLEPFLMIASGESIGWFKQLRMASSFYWNIFQQSWVALQISQIHPKLSETYEGPHSTSGKQLLWMMAGVVTHRYPIIDNAAHLWAACMTMLYGTKSIQPMMQVYYGPEHPFSVYTKDVPWVR